MLDVHPPHHPTHTWRDFFIHIATIVVGLLIAVGLEQTVEAIHHHHQRHQLREDLRAEAEIRVQRLHLNEQINADDVAWYRSILKAGREATVVNGIATYTIPSRRPRIGYISLPTNGIWPAAKASGLATVLPAEEIQLWDNGDAGYEVHMKSFYNREEALKVAFEFSERKGVAIGPGTTLHLTPDELDEMMRADARLVEETWMLERDEAIWEGSCRGILNGAKSPDDLTAFQTRAVAAMPK
jgi:hypothetical protein